MTETNKLVVTRADRMAAQPLWNRPGTPTCFDCIDELHQAFARHRIAAEAERTAAIAAAYRKGLSASNSPEGSGLASASPTPRGAGV